MTSPGEVPLNPELITNEAHQQIVDGNGSAFYYGTDEDNISKTYSVENLNDNGEATGTLVVYFIESQYTNTSQLRRIKVFENTMSFEYWHRGEYGPVKFELVKSV